MVTLEQAEADPREYLGRDIALDSDFDWKIASDDDFQIKMFYDCLEQAILHRLKTAQGELELNPNYGSRLHELLGLPGTVDVLGVVRHRVREALLQEPRIASIDTVNAVFRDSKKNIVDVELTVTPIQSLEPLNMVYELFI